MLACARAVQRLVGCSVRNLYCTSCLVRRFFRRSFPAVTVPHEGYGAGFFVSGVLAASALRLCGACAVLGLSAILCMETNPNQPPLACLLGFSGITSLVIMVWLKATAAGLGLGQLQLFAICCSLWFWFSSFVFLLIYGGFPFAERRQNTPS